MGGSSPTGVSYALAEVVAVLLLFYVPAVAILAVAVARRRKRRERHETVPPRNAWLTASQATLSLGAALPLVLLAQYLGDSNVSEIAFLLVGVALPPLAVMALALENTRAAMFSLLAWALALPVLVGFTGRWWLIDSVAGEPNSQSVGLGTLAVVLLITLPAMFSAALLAGSTRANSLNREPQPPRPTTARTPHHL